MINNQLIGDARVLISYEEWQVAEVAKLSTEQENAFVENDVEALDIPLCSDDAGSSSVAMTPKKERADRDRRYREKHRAILRENSRRARDEEDEATRVAQREANAAQHRRARDEQDEATQAATREADAAQHRQARDEEDEATEAARREADAAQHRQARIPVQRARSQETAEEHLARVQANYEERENQQRGNRKACHAKDVLNGSQKVKEVSIGSWRYPNGTPTNMCNYCRGLRWPNEIETICCQCGKVELQPFPEPPPILKALLEGEDQRSKVFRKFIVPLNNALALASIKVEHKQAGGRGYNPSVVIQGKAYYFIGPIQADDGVQPQFAQLYVHDPTLEDAARKNNLYLPRSTNVQERTIAEEILIELQNELKGCNPYVRNFIQICDIPDDQLSNATIFISEKEKTYVLNSILKKVRTLDQHSIALAVAASGIAATLLQGGWTFHSRFKAPLKTDNSTVFDIKKQSNLAQLIVKCKVVVWDEAAMNHRYLMEALDRTFKDIMGNNYPFGGKIMVLAGDFRQLPTVIKHGSRAQTVAASLKNSYLWRHFRLFELQENMRVINCGGEQAMAQRYDEWLIQLGDGNIPTINDEGYIELPSDMVSCSTIDEANIVASVKKETEFVFGNLKEKCKEDNWAEFVSKRAILAPKNSDVNVMNSICIDQLPVEAIVLASADTTVELDDVNQYPVEYLNTLNHASIPPHKLVLKKGAVVMCLRNLNKMQGLCNGTRLIVQDVVANKLLKVQ